MTRGLARGAARLWRAGLKAYGGRGRFLAAFVCVFALSLAVLAGLGLTPDPAARSPLTAEGAEALSATAVSREAPEQPVKIAIPAISLTASVANPSSTAVSVLDAALLSGAVRYPTSAELGEAGNVVIFGHSSYLPIVNNQAYKTFDGVQKLHPGDTIMVYSSDIAYTYSVAMVSREDAGSAGIPLAVSGRVLTLATCDSFGKKSDRFVVTANFVESHLISS